MNSPLRGKRCIVFVRFARLDQYGEKTGKQRLRELGQFAKEHGMTLVAADVAAGSSAHDTPVELEALIERAEIAKDFDVLLITDASRFSRNHLHAAGMQHAFAKSGVAIVMTRTG